MAAATEITEPLEPWLERIIDRALLKHERHCWEHGIGAHVVRIRIRLGILVGFMAGSGVLGGAAGAMLARALGAP